jgi:NAD/NADP transhydrogenase alpha subunit
LIPKDVEALIQAGHSVSIENNAGLTAGYNNELYLAVGAKIINITDSSLSNYKEIFKNFKMIVRVKRPNLQREQLENKAFISGTIMLGALDPFEKDSTHIDEYHKTGLLAYSIDQAILPPTDPMNVLAAMSQLTGKLALRDAITKCKNTVNKVVIIGLGTAGQSALDEARALNLSVTATVSNKIKAKELKAIGVNACVIDRTLPLQNQQKKIASIISDTDIVITTARKAGQQAPLLIPKSSLDMMKANTVIVDLAISEGGNVYSSEHDKTVITENNVLITNVSGYPKIIPNKASELWSKASLKFILMLAEDPHSIILKPC